MRGFIILFSLLFVAWASAQCQGELDVVFVRDSCYGVGSDSEWAAQYDLQVTLASKLGLSSTGVLLGFVDFGDIAKVRQPLSNNLNTVIQTLQKYQWFDTNECLPDQGLNASTELFQNGRIGAGKLVVLFSATPADDPSALLAEATTIKVQGFDIMVIAADRADPNTLQQVASSSTLYYYSQSYGSYVSQVPSLIQAMCSTSNTSSSSGSSSNSGNSNSNSNSNSGNSNSNSGWTNSGNSNSNSGNSNSNSGNSNSGNSNSNSGNSNSNSGNSNSNSGNSNSNSGNSNSNGNSNSGNSNSNGNSNSGNSNSNSGNSNSGNSNSGSSSGGSCGQSSCPQGDICCSDGPSSSNPYYCCSSSSTCCSGHCCNSDQGFQCYQGVCSYGKRMFIA